MAKIIWHDQARLMLDYHIEYALAEFGKSTALRWKKEVAAFEERVRHFHVDIISATAIGGCADAVEIEIILKKEQWQ